MNENRCGGQVGGTGEEEVLNTDAGPTGTKNTLNVLDGGASGHGEIRGWAGLMSGEKTG